jgi:polyhydroxybutyrate depolymerase
MRRLAPLLLLSVGCIINPLDPCKSAEAGDSMACPTPGELDRAFDLEVPASWDGVAPLPLIYAFHGGGGHRSSADNVTCPGGKRGDPGCLSVKAAAAGYAIVRPDGTGTRPLRNIRTWNAGGGTSEWECANGAACKANIDDMAYLDKVHALVGEIIPIDAARVYATGISNGGAISNRLACERPQRIAAIASVGGTNQFAAAGGNCPGDISVLHIHGTDDPIWVYETSTEGGVVDSDKLKLGAEDSVAAWAERNGCSTMTITQAIADTVDDGTSSERITYQGCDRPVDLIRVDGGGHTWPQGYGYLSKDRIGLVAQDFDADDLILEFFDANPR